MPIKKNTELIYDDMSLLIIDTAASLAMREGADKVNVSKILRELSITNRVFYNRFHNIDEVLETVYKDTVIKMQESVKSEYTPDKDFFKYVTDVAVKVLVNTYELKKQFSGYMFEHDSLTQSNFNWWADEIKQFISYGKEHNLIKEEIDPDMLIYSVWCFCRGFNADAVARNRSKEEAVRFFRFGFGCIMEGIKKKLE